MSTLDNACRYWIGERFGRRCELRTERGFQRSYGVPPQQKMSTLFDSIDTSGSGSITQAQFQQAFQT
jgi:hypothetical protein